MPLPDGVREQIGQNAVGKVSDLVLQLFLTGLIHLRPEGLQTCLGSPGQGSCWVLGNDLLCRFLDDGVAPDADHDGGEFA